MNGYYPDQYGGGGGGGGNNMDSMMDDASMTPAGGMEAQSLDDIVNQNSKAMRRKSMPMPFHANSYTSADSSDPRRISMIEFNGSTGSGALDGFQFDPSSAAGMSGMTSSDDHFARQNGSLQARHSMDNYGLGADFSGHASPYGGLPAPSSAYASPLHQGTGLDPDIGMSSPYLQTNFSVPLEMSDANNAAMTGMDANQMNMFNQSHFQTPMVSSPAHQNFNNAQQSQQQQGQQSQRDHGPRPSAGVLNLQHSSSGTPLAQGSRRSSQSQNVSLGSRTPSMANPQGNSQSAQGNQVSQPADNDAKASMPEYEQNLPWTAPSGGWPSTMPNNKPHMDSQYRNAYSSTGFDMLGVLMRVATRPNPEINIGSVDLSCAFVVCDAEKDDIPIVYCSENFERLTGYTRHMILGRNCRFLQSPDGKVEAGIKRTYVDDDSVLYLKNMINSRREAQISLINYRRGGQPFMNLLTMIPITWDADSVKFFVGFQVDLVEQPGSVTNKNPDGSYTINYQRGLTMPRYVFNTPETHQEIAELGTTVPRDEVSAMLTTFGAGESDMTKRLWDKILLENTDDLVHVLSLKGLFLYLSPSSRKVLEYDPGELVGTALSSVCHPSDIVPVTRELKDTSSGAAVNVVFRIRRKKSGYMWFEGHGCLHTEQGKGRKCIIMVGRERPVYTLTRSDIVAAGGIGDNELWTKMSTSGCFLYVSTNVRQLLDKQPDELVGTSIQLLMRQDSKVEFGRILELARAGKKASVKHEMINKRGQVLQAFTTIYPGDATEGLKPTFLVAQTRLLKFSRGASAAAQRPQIVPKQEPGTGGSVVPFLASENSRQSSQDSINQGSSTPMTGMSGSKLVGTDNAPITSAGLHGLQIGRQDASLASDENVFDELKTTRSTSWQYELRQMEKRNRLLAEEVQALIAAKKKRKRRKNGPGNYQKDCANCHTRVTPEWRRGPSGNRDLCNSCGLRWAKQQGRVSPRTPSGHSVRSGHSDKASKASASPQHLSNTTNMNRGPDNDGQPNNQGMSKHQAQTNVLGPTKATEAQAAPMADATKDQLAVQTQASHAPKVQKKESTETSHQQNMAQVASQVPATVDEGIEPD